MKRFSCLIPMLLATQGVWLTGCASSPYAQSDDGRAVSADAQTSVLEAELRQRLSALRNNPSQASPELIRELQGTLRALRERKAADQAVAMAPGSAPDKSGRSPSAKVPEQAATKSLEPQKALQRQASARPAKAVLPPSADAVRAVELYAAAIEAEQQDKPLQAVALYRRASNMGHAPSTKRLMEIYTEGLPGVARSYVAAVKFKQLALAQGAYIDEKYAQ